MAITGIRTRIGSPPDGQRDSEPIGRVGEALAPILRWLLVNPGLRTAARGMA
jgi:hypothetical protein